MWAKNFVDDKKLGEEIRATLKQMGDKTPYARRALKDEITRRINLIAFAAVRKHFIDKNMKERPVYEVT